MPTSQNTKWPSSLHYYSFFVLDISRCQSDLSLSQIMLTHAKTAKAENQGSPLDWKIDLPGVWFETFYLQLLWQNCIRYLNVSFCILFHTNCNICTDRTIWYISAFLFLVLAKGFCAMVEFLGFFFPCKKVQSNNALVSWLFLGGIMTYVLNILLVKQLHNYSYFIGGGSEK